MAAKHPMFGRMARYSAVIGLASGLALMAGAGSAQAQMFGGWFGAMPICGLPLVYLVT